MALPLHLQQVIEIWLRGEERPGVEVHTPCSYPFASVFIRGIYPFLGRGV